MSKYIYAMSDIHGCVEAFDEALQLIDLSGENELVLCGDYVHGGGDDFAILDKIMKLECKYGTDKVIVLCGNHEEMACTGRWPLNEDRFSGVGMNNDNNDDDKYIYWMQSLRKYYVVGNTIFVHAGIDEEAGDLWEWDTTEYDMMEKYPADIGKFECGDIDMKIVAGHVGTAEISGNPRFHSIFYDGQSHYYIDSTVLDSNFCNVLKFDVNNEIYYEVFSNGAERIIDPYSYEI